MAQTNSTQKGTPASLQAAQPKQGRLILQDPAAFDQSSQPALRTSLELTIDSAPIIEREKARDLWESLSMEPEAAQERQVERKRLLARSQAMAQESEAAKTEMAALKAQIAKQGDDRFNHPLIYAGGAAILGMGALVWLERRKRLQAQEREMDMLAAQSDTDFDVVPKLSTKTALSRRAEQAEQAEQPQNMDFTEELAQEFATDLNGLPGDIKTASSALAQSAQPAQILPTPDIDEGDMPDWALPQPEKPYAERQVPLPSDLEVAVLASRGKEEQSLLSLPKRVLSNILARKSKQEAKSSSHLPTEILSTNSVHADQYSTLIAQDFDEGSQWGADQEAQLAFEQELRAQQLQGAEAADLDAGSYDPDQANIELLTQTRVKPISGENAMEHLLELRTAVNGLCVLGRPEGASRLLQEHIDANPDTCAWAYLELMQICEMLNARDDFEIMRKRYRTQFNRMAPYWFEPNSHVLGLDGYARATGELCNAWALGKQQAHQMLHAWLIGPMLGRKIMQLPAYHDLFDLYEMLEFVNEVMPTQGIGSAAPLLLSEPVLSPSLAQSESKQGDDFVATVSLLDLDYEFSSDVTLEEKEVLQSERAVTIVKTGNFSVDFNVTGTQLGGLPSMPADLPKK
jgi:hypothetical protein